MMTILEHILAGHYPKDDKGRALVPHVKEGMTFAVCTTDVPDDYYPILGFLMKGGQVVGIERLSGDTDRLLPPQPRKVPVKMWALFVNGRTTAVSMTQEESLAKQWAFSSAAVQIVELNGERELPWEKITDGH